MVLKIINLIWLFPIKLLPEGIVCGEEEKSKQISYHLCLLHLFNFSSDFCWLADGHYSVSDDICRLMWWSLLLSLGKAASQHSVSSLSSFLLAEWTGVSKQPFKQPQRQQQKCWGCPPAWSNAMKGEGMLNIVVLTMLLLEEGCKDEWNVSSILWSAETGCKAITSTDWWSLCHFIFLFLWISRKLYLAQFIFYS